MKYELEDRTYLFAKKTLILCKKLQRNKINEKIIDQLIRFCTSAGANYREANETDTKRDFLHKLRLAKKEAKETIYWLRLLLDFNQSNDSEIEFLLNESKEIMLILGSIYQSTKKAGSK